MIDRLCSTITFLRSHGIVHFDAHLNNVVGDGQTVCLTDFGLVVDPQFELNSSERGFLARHSHYDYGEAIASTGFLVRWSFGSLEPEAKARVVRKYGMDAVRGDQHLGILLEHVDDLAAEGDLALEPEYVAAMVRYRPVIQYMHTFLTTLRRDPRKRTPYDDRELRRLLDACGVPLP